MSSIDDRVVGLKFDNAQFEQGVQQTLASLDALNKGLKLEGATKGINDVQAAANNVQLGHIASAVDDIANHFKAMSIIAITALANIVTRAFDAGASLVKSLTVDPINAGLQEYQTNINAIQTILSNTRWQKTGLNDVTKALDELNHYADLTIYNFTEMAKNIGTFTAAGVKLDVAVNAIKGIANLAAVSGSSAQQASVAMYQLSQAIATGTVKLIDWNSVVNAGLGGKVFQDALVETARVHGVAVDKMIKDAGSFRASLEKGWLKASILTETLARFTGDLSEKQLLSLGYSKEQALASIAMGKDAQEAATKVKTLTQLISTLQEAAGSGWTQTWSIIFGNFNEAKTLFTDVYTTLNQFVSANADARNKLLQAWKDMGGRSVLIEAIGQAFKDVLAFLKPFEEAFRQVFPKTTAQDLYNASVFLLNLSKALQISDENANNLKRTFAGVFALFDIGFQVIKQIIRVLFDLFQSATAGGSGVLEFTGNVGDFIVALDDAIKKGESLTKFFDNLERILQIPIQALRSLGVLIGAVFSGFDPKPTEKAVLEFVSGVDPLTALADTIVAAWAAVISQFTTIVHFFGPIASKFVSWFHDISDAVGGLNFDSLLKAINTGLFASLIYLIHNNFGKEGLGGLFQTLTNSLQTMQHTLRAATLLEIALALGVLAAAVLALSTIDSQKLAVAMAGLTVMFTELIAALALVSRIPKTNVISLYATAASMVVLATAIDVLVIAIKQLSKIDAKGLHRGLISVAVLLGSLVATVKLMPPSERMIATGAGLVVLSGAVKILATVVSDLSQLNWEEMAKGLTATGAILASLALFTRFASTDATSVLSGAGIVLLAAGIKILASAMHDIATLDWESIGKGMTVLAGALTAIGVALTLIPPTSVFSAAGVLIAAASLKLIGDAVAQMGNFSWGEIGKGLTTLAGALTLIGLAISLIPPTAPLSAAGILIVALSLGMLADALKQMGDMKWGTIAKGLVAMAGVLGIIAVSLTLMTGALPGALAVLVVAGALTVLTGVLEALGHMSWGEIIKGLVTLAATFVILGVAGALLGPVVPTLLGFGAAVALIGAGLALAGAGVFLFATGLTALSVAGAAGAAAVVAILSAVIGLIPELVKQLGVALLALIDILAAGIPKIVDFLIKLLLQLFKGLDEILPPLADVIIKLVDLILKILVDAVPKMVDAGLTILLGVLNGIKNHITNVVAVALLIIANFLLGVAKGLPSIIDSGFKLIIAFINGLSKAIDNNSEQLGEAGANLAISIIEGMVKGLHGGISRIADEARKVAKSALNAALDFLGINSPSKEFFNVGRYSDEGFALGLDKFSGMVSKAATGVGEESLASLKDSMKGFNDVIKGPIDLNPVITPVLDLTKVQRDAGELGKLLPMQPIQVNATYASARQAFSDAQTNKNVTDNNNNNAGDTFNYIQNNTSPKALSTADIYRNTKNQLSTAKGGLPK